MLDNDFLLEGEVLVIEDDEGLVYEPEKTGEKLDILINKYPQIENLFFTDGYWIQDPKNSTERLLPRKNIEWLLHSVDQQGESNMKAITNAMVGVIKKWKIMYPDKNMGKRIATLKRYVVVNEEQFVDLVWFIHRYAGTKDLRTKMRISETSRYIGPHYTKEVRQISGGDVVDSFIADIVQRHDGVGIYFEQATKTPLLNFEEEIALMKRIEKGRELQRELDQSGKRIKKVKKQQHEEMIEDGKIARDHLINANTRLVISVAKIYAYKKNSPLPFLDLIQEGNLGLMKAIEKYDYHRGNRFGTYATWWIRQSITRGIADQGRTIRIPVYMNDRIHKLKKLSDEFEQTRGRKPYTEELAKLEIIGKFILKESREPEKHEIDEVMAKTIKQLKFIETRTRTSLSLETPVSHDDDTVLGDFIEDEGKMPGENAEESEALVKINNALSFLSPREAKILRLRTGLHDGKSYTLEEIAKKYELTRERIRQIEGRALRRLRHPSRARHLRIFLQDR